MSKKIQFGKFFNKFDVVKTICKNTYCAEQKSEELSACHKECSNNKKLRVFNENEYKDCQTKCNQEKQNEGKECEKKCDTKKNIIEEAARKYYKDSVLNHESRKELQKHIEEITLKQKLQYEQACKQAEEKYLRDIKVNPDTIKKELLYQVKEIMEKSDNKLSAEHVKNIAEVEENYVSDAYYGTEFFV